MDDFVIRPLVADLVFRLYDSPLPGDAVEAVAERSVRWADGAFRLRLTRAGHILEWSRRGTHIVELTTTADWPLATARLSHPFQGERRGRLQLPGGVQYQVGLQVELLDDETFAAVHDDLAAYGENRGLLHRFSPHHRISLTPLGLAVVEPVASGLSVATFHTFPGELKIVKTQSLIELSLPERRRRG